MTGIRSTLLTRPSKYVGAGVSRPKLDFSAVFFVLALFVPIARILPGGVGQVWNYAVLGTLVVVVAAGKGKKPLSPLLWIFAGYAAIAASVTSSAASGIASTVLVGLQFVILLAIGPFALRGMVRDSPRFLSSVVGGFMVGQTASAAAGIAQMLGVSVLGYSQGLGRSPGLSTHPNVLGVMSGVAIILSLHALSSNEWRRKRLLAVVLACNSAGLVSTGSVSAMIACGLGIAVFLVAHRVNVFRVIAGAGFAYLLFVLVIQIPVVAQYFSNPVDRLLQVTGQTEDVSTLAVRVQTVADAWAHIQSDPFLGRGLDNANSAPGAGSTAVHNLIVHAWYQGGIVFGIAIALVVTFVIIKVAESLAKHRDGTQIGILVTVTGYALTSAFFEQSYYWLPILMAWVCLTESGTDLEGASLNMRKRWQGSRGLR